MSDVSQSYLQFLGFCMFSFTDFLKMILLLLHLQFDRFGDSESGSKATCYGLSWLVLH